MCLDESNRRADSFLVPRAFSQSRTCSGDSKTKKEDDRLDEREKRQTGFGTYGLDGQGSFSILRELLWSNGAGEERESKQSNQQNKQKGCEGRCWCFGENLFSHGVARNLPLLFERCMR